MDGVTSGNIDIYTAFGVTPDALQQEITRKYRQLALKYHPDKNPSPEALEKFRFFAAINTVLQDPNLRRQYDEIRRQKTATGAGNVANQIQRFKEQLRQREYEANVQKTQENAQKNNANVEVLAMRGLKLRREVQANLALSNGYVSYKTLEIPNTTHEFLLRPTKVEVTWKYRNEAAAQIDAETLRRIMARFGPVKLCYILGNDGLYVKGHAEFEVREDAERALAYEYKSARLWDGTPVRKLASLLRSVKPVDSEIRENVERPVLIEEIDEFLKSLHLE